MSYRYHLTPILYRSLGVSFFSPGTTMGGDGAGGFGLRTSIAAVVGGTASEIGGGKFSNGAVTGAFVHMFNAEARALVLKRLDNYRKSNEDRKLEFRKRVFEARKLYSKVSTDGLEAMDIGHI